MITAEDEFVKRLSNKLIDAIAIADQQIIQGGSFVPDFAEYQNRIGYRRGLYQTLTIIIPEVIKEMGS